MVGWVPYQLIAVLFLVSLHVTNCKTLFPLFFLNLLFYIEAKAVGSFKSSCCKAGVTCDIMFDCTLWLSSCIIILYAWLRVEKKQSATLDFLPVHRFRLIPSEIALVSVAPYVLHVPSVLYNHMTVVPLTNNHPLYISIWSSILILMNFPG